MVGKKFILSTRVNILVAVLFAFFAMKPALAQKQGNDVLDEIKPLESKVIYFGHQSVGKNIIGGLEALLAENSAINLKVRESTKADGLQPGVFVHSPVGKNGEPQTKDRAFSENVSALAAGDRKVDIAFYKYCYADIKKDTDVESLFTQYKKNYEKVKSANPDVQFIHVTTPLTVVQSGPKAWIKKLIGKPVGGYDDNIKRNQFNNMMREEYGDSGRFFDLARLESTHQDGTRELFNQNGQTYESLVEQYASDGRHLNNVGAKYIAKELLKSLARAVEEK